MRIPHATTIVLTAALLGAGGSVRGADDGFDHDYARYADLLRTHVTAGRVDYAALAADTRRLEQIVQAFGSVTSDDVERWPRDRQLAFWINAYNVFTLKAIIDHYPIQAGWLSLAPRNSIRQIDGVWDEIPWSAAGRRVTLDDIEHAILGPTFDEPRIHFAINCASISCPPLRAEPYVASRLDAQLTESSRRYLASEQGVQVDGSTIRVTSILDWYGEDFVDAYAGLTPDDRSPKDRAVLGVVAQFGPPAAAALATSGSARLRYLRYDWSLNDIQQ